MIPNFFFLLTAHTTKYMFLQPLTKKANLLSTPDTMQQLDVIESHITAVQRAEIHCTPDEMDKFIIEFMHLADAIIQSDLRCI